MKISRGTYLNCETLSAEKKCGIRVFLFYLSEKKFPPSKYRFHEFKCLLLTNATLILYHHSNGRLTLILA